MMTCDEMTWVSFSELEKEHSFGNLVRFLKAGLQPYDVARNPVYCPYNLHEYSYVVSLPPEKRGNRLMEIVESDPGMIAINDDPRVGDEYTKFSWKFVWCPDGKKKKKLLALLQTTQFNKTELEKAISVLKQETKINIEQATEPAGNEKGHVLRTYREWADYTGRSVHTMGNWYKRYKNLKAKVFMEKGEWCIRRQTLTSGWKRMAKNVR